MNQSLAGGTDQREGRVLVLDDEQIIVMALREILASEGYEVVTCTDPIQALESLKKQKFAVILSDQGQRYLLVVTNKNIVERRDVSLGALEGDLRIIKKGVGAGDWIVVGSVGGLNKVVPGDPVKRRIVVDVPKKGA